MSLSFLKCNLKTPVLSRFWDVAYWERPQSRKAVKAIKSANLMSQNLCTLPLEGIPVWNLISLYK
jgi:hypothetical protein